jgi:hypothetical protein
MNGAQVTVTLNVISRFIVNQIVVKIVLKSIKKLTNTLPLMIQLEMVSSLT